MKHHLIILLLLLFSGSLLAQSSIFGKITDEETGEELIYANLVIHKNGVFVTGTSTDFEGNYSMQVDSGMMELYISYTGYPDRKITGIEINKNEHLKLDISLSGGLELIDVVNICCGCPPLIEQDNTTSGSTITSDDIIHQPNKNIKDFLLNTSGVSINNY